MEKLIIKPPAVIKFYDLRRYHGIREETQMAKYNKEDRPEVTPEQMYEIATKVAERSLNNPDIAKKLRETDLIVRFEYHDEERWGPDFVAEITVDCTKDPVEIHTGPCDLKPNLEMSMEAFTAHLFWMQKLNLMTALTRKQIKAKGPIQKAMKLLPHLKVFYENYRNVLKELGREDLLAFPPD